MLFGIITVKQIKKIQDAATHKFLFTVLSTANNLYAACERRMLHYSINTAAEQKTCFSVMQCQVVIFLYSRVATLTDLNKCYRNRKIIRIFTIKPSP